MSDEQDIALIRAAQLKRDRYAEVTAELHEELTRRKSDLLFKRHGMRIDYVVLLDDENEFPRGALGREAMVVDYDYQADSVYLRDSSGDMHIRSSAVALAAREAKVRKGQGK